MAGEPAYIFPVKGRGMEFAEVRPYMIGDDVRNMDWKITARTGKPHTKLYREERDRSVYILLISLKRCILVHTDNSNPV